MTAAWSPFDLRIRTQGPELRGPSDDDLMGLVQQLRIHGLGHVACMAWTRLDA